MKYYEILLECFALSMLWLWISRVIIKTRNWVSEYIPKLKENETFQTFMGFPAEIIVFILSGRVKLLRYILFAVIGVELGEFVSLHVINWQSKTK